MLRSISFESIVVSAKSPKTTMKPNWSHAQKIVGKHCFPTVPFQQFQVLFTLFSKYFSSFPHGTCSLSVSHQYLALDGIYHPLWSAVPNKSTLRKACVEVFGGGVPGYNRPWQRVIKRIWPPLQTSIALCRLQLRRLSVWAIPASVALTNGIPVGFFSST